MRSFAAAGRSLVAALLALGVLIAATGWLYVFYPKVSLPGPTIRDALPLDELSKHSTAPLLLFVGIWAAAALLLGSLTRFARAERLTAAALRGNSRPVRRIRIPRAGAPTVSGSGLSLRDLRRNGNFLGRLRRQSAWRDPQRHR